MAYKIEIKVRFRAGHRLLSPYVGKCNNPHGEGYTAICIFEKDYLNECGMVMDFGEIKRKINSWIDENWDHAYICNSNDELLPIFKALKFKVFELSNKNPSAEIMAEELFRIIKNKINPYIKKVGIIESFEDSIAWYDQEELK